MPNKPAVALDAMPDTQELLAANQWGDGKRTYLEWVAAGKPRALPVKREKTGSGVRPWHPYRSKWEYEYAHYLASIRSAHMIERFDYEPDRLEIGEGARYTPDFKLTQDDGSIEYHEVKGYRREAAMVRIRVAAKIYPQFRFVLVTKVDGQWKHTTIGPQR